MEKKIIPINSYDLRASNTERWRKHFKQNEDDRKTSIPYWEYLHLLQANPDGLLQNIYQTFSKMIEVYLGSGKTVNRNDTEDAGFRRYNGNKMFSDNQPKPFVPSNTFLNRLIEIKKMMTSGIENKYYLFMGKQGSGKTSFLDCILRKFEEFTGSEEGMMFAAEYHLPRSIFSKFDDRDKKLADLIAQVIKEKEKEDKEHDNVNESADASDDVVIKCPYCCHPVTIIPIESNGDREFRLNFLADLLKLEKRGDIGYSYLLRNSTEYNWVRQWRCCPFCESMYAAIDERINSDDNLKHHTAFDFLKVRRYLPTRRMGYGISVYNLEEPIAVQHNIDNLSDIRRWLTNNLGPDVFYGFSANYRVANGILALEELKGENAKRFLSMQTVVSNEIEKIDGKDVPIHTLVLVVCNPENFEPISKVPENAPLMARVEKTDIPYPPDLPAEKKIYQIAYDQDWLNDFMPLVVETFALVMVSTRYEKYSQVIKEWLGHKLANKYIRYSDPDGLILRIALANDDIPFWMKKVDWDLFSKDLRKRFFAELQKAGIDKGIGSRDSIKILGAFHKQKKRENHLLSIKDLLEFFEKFPANVSKINGDFNNMIPEGFIECAERYYQYNLLRLVKKAGFQVFPEEIKKQVLHYLFAIFENNNTEKKCRYTGEVVKITEEFIDNIETKLVDGDKGNFRKEVRRTYNTLTLHEIGGDHDKIVETELYGDLYKRLFEYQCENCLDDYLKNKNFRRAVSDCHKPEFRIAYDKKLQDEINFIINNLQELKDNDDVSFGYTEQSAQEALLYVIDEDLVSVFRNNNYKRR